MDHLMIVSALIASALFFLAKKPWITSSVSIQKQTDNGETVVFNTNFSAWDSQDSMKKKTDKLFGLGDARLAFVDARFKAALAAAEAEQTSKVSKLK